MKLVQYESGVDILPHLISLCLSPSSKDKLLLLLLLLLLLPSRFSRVRPCATPQTEARQAPPSLGLSRQEHWSRLPFPSPTRESDTGVHVSL